MKRVYCENPNVVIINSTVEDCIFHGTGSVVIVDSVVEKSTFDSPEQIAIYNSEVSYSYFKDYSVIFRSFIERLTQLSSGSKILIGDRVRLKYAGKFFTQKNSAILRNNTYREFPVSLVSSGGDIITDAPHKQVTVNCVTNSYEKWLGEAGRRYGRLNGYTKEQMDEIEKLVRFIKRLDSEG